MASLQFRNGAYRLLFQYNGRQATYTVGSVPLTEARQWKSRTENLLMRVEQRMLEVPRGVAIADFIRCDGKPPVDPAILIRKDTTLHQLTDGYITTVSNGAIEANTLATAKTHVKHLEKTLSGGFLLAGLTLGKLQYHITRRATKVSAVTIKKELDTFRSIWNWGLRMKWVDQPFPCSGLIYPKTEEKLPFMTWEEIDRRVKAGGNSDNRAAISARFATRVCYGIPAPTERRRAGRGEDFNRHLAWGLDDPEYASRCARRLSQPN